MDEFRILCHALFRNNKGETYEINDYQLRDIFSVFDSNKDEQIDKEEFTFCWNNWIKIVGNFLQYCGRNDFFSTFCSLCTFSKVKKQCFNDTP